MEIPLNFTNSKAAESGSFQPETADFDASSPAVSALPQPRPKRRVPPQPGLDVPATARLMQDYLLDGDYRGYSQETLATRRVMLKNLLWFLRQRKFER